MRSKEELGVPMVALGVLYTRPVFSTPRVSDLDYFNGFFGNGSRPGLTTRPLDRLSRRVPLLPIWMPNLPRLVEF